jgi:hypothetical protein
MREMLNVMPPDSVQQQPLKRWWRSIISLSISRPMCTRCVYYYYYYRYHHRLYSSSSIYPSIYLSIHLSTDVHTMCCQLSVHGAKAAHDSQQRAIQLDKHQKTFTRERRDSHPATKPRRATISHS